MGFTWSQCPTYTHKDDVVEGISADLPEGYFVYLQNGHLIRSSLQEFKADTLFVPSRIITYINTYVTPNDTSFGGYSSGLKSPEISDDGMWITAIENHSKVILMRENASIFDTIPFSFSENYDFTSCPEYEVCGNVFAGFLRNSPKSNVDGANKFEIWVANADGIFAMEVDVTDEKNIQYSGERTLFKFTSSFSGRLRLEVPDVQISIVADQIHAVFISDGPGPGDSWGGENYYPVYITIPDSGLGIASEADVYQWADSNAYHLWGCGIGMSHDGQYTIGNSGTWGNSCVPNKVGQDMDHKGFYMAPFKRKDDVAINLHDHLNKYGTSINWVPEEYRISSLEAADFTGWQFANDSKYIIGMSRGTAVPKAVWMVDWMASEWIQVTPEFDESNEALDPAVFTGSPGNPVVAPIQGGNAVDDPNDPKIVFTIPSMGDTIVAGDSCIILYGSMKPAGASLVLTNGRDTYSLDLESAIDPYQESYLKVFIPYTFTTDMGNTVELSGKWSFKASIYGGAYATQVEVYIKNSKSTPILAGNYFTKKLRVSQSFINVPDDVNYLELFNLLGKKIWSSSVEPGSQIAIPSEFMNSVYILRAFE